MKPAWMATLLVFGATSALPAQSLAGPETLYVQASTLRLRDKPTAKSKTKGRLSINFPLRILREEGEFVEVRALNQSTGWVGKAFLGPTRVTVEGALEQARSAKTPQDRLTWLQRAAALSPSDLEIMTQLRDTYRELKDAKAAAMVDTLVTVLKRRWFPIPQHLDPGVWVEWHEAEWPGAETQIPKKDWAKYDVTEDLVFWVLPEHGAAVPARVAEVWPDSWNECGGVTGINLKLDVKLPPGERALVAVLGEPPASWKRPAPAPDKAPIEAAFEAYVAKALAGRGEVFKSLAVFPGGGYGVAAVYLGPADEHEIVGKYELHRVELDAAGRINKATKRTEEVLFLQLPVARRDVTGDGNVETIYDDNCSTYVESKDGAPLFSSYMRCCGC
ncbi:MAG: SH3 domain-containing protein [Deltaproteobacteria bacterium]|nr:SH3 domain-containing protein [Deltaproteobacteria bacterium]